jgi:hypothetical protein
MAATRRKARSRASATRATATDGHAPRSGASEARAQATDRTNDALDPSSALDAVFREEADVRAIASKRLKSHVEEADIVAGRANAAFKNFMPTMFTRAERERRNYLAPEENLARSTRAIVERGVETLRESADQRKLRIGGPLTALMTNPDGSLKPLEMDKLLKHIDEMLADAPTLTNDPARTACDAEARADQLLSEVEGNGTVSASGAATGPLAAPAATNGGGPADASVFAKQGVGGLTGKVVSPEDQLVFEVDKRARLVDTESNVDTFALRAGASDVTSYHDFNSLQIAFEHIWTEMFDESLKSLGIQLYHEAAVLEKFLRPGATTNLNFDITSIPDLLRLVREIKQLNGLATDVAEEHVEVAVGVENGKILTRDVAVVPGAERLSRLLDEIALRLKERYAFAVFAKDSVNFGILITYRQTWTPESYQVGDLVSTLPLAPRETRRYTTKRVVKKTRAVKEVEDALRTTRTESTGTSRVEREIVDGAQEKTNFDLTAHGSYGGEKQGYQVDATSKSGGEQAAQSLKTKKHFHEAVLKSAEDYKQQHRLEIDTSASDESEETTFNEIQNPNDELTVTYMFYELQRRYRVRERIHQLTPVILVANEMPAPDAIDDAWLTAHDWILRRVILDDSFKPALDYLTKSFIGAELNIQLLDANAKAQKAIVDELKTQITIQLATLEVAQRGLAAKQDVQVATETTEGILGTIKKALDPLGITGNKVLGTGEGVQAAVDYAQEGVDRAEREKARLLDQLGAAVTALQVAIDKLASATKEHYDRIAEIDRLRMHVKQNIFYYMQAIWSHEPPDQRFFRVYNVEVPIIEPDTTAVNVTASPASPTAYDLLTTGSTITASIPVPPVKVTKKKLVEVADLDTVLGYKGNYAIYALNENNYITLNMMQDYLDISDVVKLRDPDALSSYSMSELQALADCMRKKNRTSYEKYRNELRDLMIKRLMSGLPEDDRVIVPTDSLFIEALVGTHPLLEDFKLIHRALDAKKVQAEVRHAELENVRLGARALRGKDDDPEIDKRIVIQGDVEGVIPGD